MANAPDKAPKKEEFIFKCEQYPSLRFEPKKNEFLKFSPVTGQIRGKAVVTHGIFRTEDPKVASYLRNYKGIAIKEIKRK